METSLYLKAFFILVLLISLIGVVVTLMKFFKNKNILTRAAFKKKVVRESKRLL